MITCPNCGKENQDHYKFCLACGSKLAPAQAAPAVSVPQPPALGQTAPTPGPQPPAPAPAPAAPPPVAPPPVVGPPPPASGQPEPPRPPTAPPVVPSPVGAPPQPPGSTPTAAGSQPSAPVAEGNACPSCGMDNPPGFRFCGRCGTRLEEAAPPAPAKEDVGTAQTVFVGNAKEAFANMQQPPAAAEQPPAPMGGPSQPAPPPTGPGAADPAAAEAGPPAGMEPSEEPAASGHAKLVMLGPDGQPIGERLLAMGETLEVGRNAGPPWEDDAYLNQTHANLTPIGEGIRIEDFDSLNGVFVKLVERAEVHHGDQFRVGQELLRYEDLPEPTPTEDGTERMGSPNPGYWGRVCLLVAPDRESAAYPIEGEGITIGRESGDITFPQDGYVSGRHCRISGDDDGIYIEDVGSSNGTYMRVRTGQTVPYGSLVLIGQKLFQLEQS